jgi:hypothetical protein
MARLFAHLFLLSVLAGCGGTLRRFPLRDPLWVDDDTRAFKPRPAEWYSPYVWDGMDNSVFRPTVELFRFELDREAIDVNAMDEVPASSWYTPARAVTPEELARGACGDDDPATPGVDDDVRGPFTITRGKPDGASPGFFVEDADGRTYLLKPDGDLQPERASAADAIGAAVFHAAGYFVPCNRVVFVRPDELLLAPDAELRRTDGFRGPLDRAAVDEVLEHAARLPDGRLRFGLSRFVEGDPISAWTYDGTWDDDPNDVVPHEHRRELRAMYVLSSWLDHIDSRQENTLASWIEREDGRGYVRHYVIDMSDSLGILFEWEGLAERFGHSGYFDPQHIFEDFATLGLADRPWHHAHFGAAGRTLGYFDLERYDPDEWRPGYPNPAFERMTELDAAWMARIVARFGDAHLEALAERARFADPVARSELLRILVGRRDRVLERWLTRLSPLTDPRIVGDRLCLEDRALVAGLRSRAGRRYRAQAFLGDALAPQPPLELHSTGDAVCVPLPEPRGSRHAPSYVVVDVIASSERLETTGPARVHAYDLGGPLYVVGLERPSGPEPPRP